MSLIILPLFHGSGSSPKSDGDQPEDYALGAAVLLAFCVFSFFGGDLVGMLIGQHLSDATERRLYAETKELHQNIARAATWAFELERRHKP